MTNQIPTEEFNVDEAQIGRVLHFVIDKGYKLQCRPAIVVEDWPDQGKPGYVNLVVFVDGSNDSSYDSHSHDYSYSDGQMVIGGSSNLVNVKTSESKMVAHTDWQTSVNPNHAVKAKGTWHWPRECKGMQSPADPYVSDGIKHHHDHAGGFVDIRNCYACSKESEEKEKTNA